MKETETLISYRKPELLGTIPPDGIPKLAFGITPLSGFMMQVMMTDQAVDSATTVELGPPLDHVGLTDSGRLQVGQILCTFTRNRTWTKLCFNQVLMIDLLGT